MTSSHNFKNLFLHFHLLALGCSLWLFGGQQRAAAQTDWPYVGGDAGGMRYSALDQINRKNVKDLQVAWTFHTGSNNFAYGGHTDPSMQCTPVVIDGVMYLTSIDTQVMALDAATGRELWRFNPHRTKDGYLSNRGVAYWSDGRRGGARRILFAIPDGKLFSLDARTGMRVWHYQLVRHDLWDYDLPTPPNLVIVNHGGKRSEAVAQVTKTGYVFLFERATGKPLFEIIERPAPASDVPGEQMDGKFRAFDKATGRLLWEHQLPAGGYAASCTYSVKGRQYVVIAAGGGGKPKTKAGDAYVAFALPQTQS